MKKGERGSASSLVVIMVFCFSAILFGTYLTSMTLQKSQQKSNLRMQAIYGDDVNKIDEIYTQIIKEKADIDINYNPNGGEKDASANTLETVLSVANVDEEDVSIYYAWNKSNKEEPVQWETCENEQKVQKNNIEPGTYYLWSKVDDAKTQQTLKTDVSEKFVVKEGDAKGEYITEEKITCKWQEKYEWGIGTKETPKYYQICMDITNNSGATIKEWEIKYNVQPGIVIEESNIWCADVEVDGNTITMKNFTWNAEIGNGSTLNLEFILAFDNEQELSIDNIIFNEKIIKKE